VHRVAVSRAMRRSTEKMIAVQVLTVIVAVTGLLLAQLLAGPHRTQAPGHFLSGHGFAGNSASPWHSLKRLMHREFWFLKGGRGAPATPEPPAAAPENTRGQ
jgi:hypothetical protein